MLLIIEVINDNYVLLICYRTVDIIGDGISFLGLFCCLFLDIKVLWSIRKITLRNQISCAN